MHEFGVTQAAVEAALAQAEESAAARVTAAHLAIGAVSSIEPDTIRMYWAEIAEGTIAENAALHFRHVPVECRCVDCKQLFIVDMDLQSCPACGGEQTRAVDDEYLALEALDIEKLHPESVSE